MAALIITVLTAVFAASGVTWQPVDPASLTQARIVASDALYMFLKPDVPCGPQDRAGCAYYALAALQASIPGLTWADLAAIITQTEYGIVWGADTRAIISELVWRSLFDPQSGGCRYARGLYDCRLDYVLAWLGTQQGIIDAVLITEGHAVVHVARLTGVRNCAALYCQGYTRFVDYLSSSVVEHLDIWRTGLGPFVPSASGLFCLPSGATLLGHFFARREMGICDGGAVWWLIVGTGNRHTVIGN